MKAFILEKSKFQCPKITENKVSNYVLGTSFRDSDE